jgi:hypothetical protein
LAAISVKPAILGARFDEEDFHGKLTKLRNYQIFQINGIKTGGGRGNFWTGLTRFTGLGGEF